MNTQSARTYLFVLAVLLIIALVVAGVLDNVPRRSGSSVFWENASVTFASYSLSPAATTLNVKNMLDHPVTLSSVTLIINGRSHVVNSTPVALVGGQTKTLLGAGLCATPGSLYHFSAKISYSDAEGSYMESAKGDVLQGVCAR